MQLRWNRGSPERSHESEARGDKYLALIPKPNPNFRKTSLAYAFTCTFALFCSGSGRQTGIECLPGEYSQTLREQGVPTTAWLMKKYKRAWLKPTCRSCDSRSHCVCGAVCVLLPVDPTCASVAVCTSLTTRVLFAAAKSWLFSHSLPVKALCSAQGR